MPSLTELIILILAAWRITHLFLADGGEGGPWDVLHKFRHLIGVRFDEHSNAFGRNMFAEMFTCIYCLGFWVSLIVFLISLIPYGYYALMPFAISGGLLVVRKFT